MRSAIASVCILLAAIGLLAHQARAQAVPGATVSAPASRSAIALNTLPPGPRPLLVKADFSLSEIDNIDEESETFEFTGVLTLSWHDARQAFDPRIEGVAEKIFSGDFQFDEVFSGWWPQAVLVNEAGLYDRHAVLLRISPDGGLTLIQSVNATAKARLDLRRLPFDGQSLHAAFAILGFDNKEVMLQSPSAHQTATLFTDHEYSVPQWHLSEMKLTTAQRPLAYGGRTEAASILVASFDLQRKPLFFLRLVVLPLGIMVMLSWVIFWMDKSSLGDRINVSFIGILTAVAYQMMLDDSLPQIAYITLMNGFLSISFLMMCSSVVVNLRVSSLDRHGHRDLGDRLDRRCRWLFPSIYFGLLLLLPLVISLLPPPD